MKENNILPKKGPRPYFRHYAVADPIQKPAIVFNSLRAVLAGVAVFIMLFSSSAPAVLAEDALTLPATETTEQVENTTPEVLGDETTDSSTTEEGDTETVTDETLPTTEETEESVKEVLQDRLAAIAVDTSCSLEFPATVVTPSDTQGWNTDSTGNGGVVDFVYDPSSPAQEGALSLTTTSDGPSKAQYMHAANTPLSQLGELCYYTKQNSASFEDGAPSYQLPMFLNGTSGFTTFVFEPYQNGNVNPGTWQSWDVDSGQFWSTRSVQCAEETIQAGGGGAPFYTLAEIAEMCPHANVIGFGVNIGTNNPSYDTEAEYVRFGNTLYDFEPDPVQPVTILAHKIVCDDESYLPNRNGGADITATTATSFVAAHSDHCKFESNWDFQWGYGDKETAEGVDMTTGTWTGAAAAGADSTGLCPAPWCGANTTTGSDYNQWHNFDSSAMGSTPAKVTISDLNGSSALWVREVLKPGYMPFSAPQTGQDLDSNDVSAELYCSTDVLNYDNFEFIENVEAGETYYCVAFNVRNAVEINATKIVCDDETHLPNMAGGADITEDTAADFLAAHSDHCHLEEWDFQWGFGDSEFHEGVDMTTGDWIGEAGAGGASTGLCPTPWCGPNTTTGSGFNQWKTFNSANPALITDLEGASAIWVREVLKPGYHPFSAPKAATPLDADNVSAEIYCGNDVLNYDNFDFIQDVEIGDVVHCVAFNAAEGTTIKATKIVCENESYLPNWGTSSPVNITADTAADFLAEGDNAEHCHLQDWDFQWGYGDRAGEEGVDMTTGNHMGIATAAGDSTGLCPTPWCGPNTGTGADFNQWKGFASDATNDGITTVVVPLVDGVDRIWVREVLKDGYQTFSAPVAGVNMNTNDVSAELYCHDDVFNYDNYDYVANPEAGEVYYCVAFNAHVDDEEPCRTQTVTFMSDESVTFEGMTGITPANLSDDTAYPVGTDGNAVEADDTGFPGAWDTASNDANLAGAKWVSNTAVAPGNPPAPGGSDGTVDTWYLFSKQFTIPAGATSITATNLYFTADNSVTAYIDENLIGTSASFNSVASAALPITLTPGTHELEFAVKNDAFQGQYNPTGVIFKMEISYCDNGGGNPGGEHGISGNVYSDANQDNNKNDDEDGLAGWTVELYKLDPEVAGLGEETPFLTDLSDENGDYAFTGLDDGCYIVREVVQAGWVQTEPTNEAHEYEVSLGDAECGGIVEAVTDFLFKTAEAAGETVIDLDFGNYQAPNTSNDGGSSGSRRRNTTDDSSDGLTPEVLGDTTDVPSILDPRVLGDSTTDLGTLPRTGVSTVTLLLIVLFGLVPFAAEKLAARKK